MYFVLDVMVVVLHIGQSGRVDALSFSPDGTYLCAGDARGSILVWAVESCTLVQKIAKGSITDTSYIQVTTY